MLPWLKAQSAVLLTLWLQPSGRMEGETQNMMQNIMTPHKWPRAPKSTAATKIILEGQSKRKTAKSIASLHHVSNPCPKSHITLTRDGRTFRSCLLWSKVLLWVFQSFKSLTPANKTTEPLKHHLYLRWHDSSTQLDRITFDQLFFHHLWRTEKWQKLGYSNPVENCGWVVVPS